MRIEDLNWMDVEQYLKSDDRLILTLGATHQHGYLSLSSDNRLIQALADAATQKTGTLTTPCVNYGVSPYFLDYPGTFSLRVSTLHKIVEDLVRSAYQQGFQRIMIINGHEGNEGCRTKLYELINKLPDLKLVWYSWFSSHSLQVICEKHKIKPAHGNWLEAFPFNIVNELPDTIKKPPHIPGLLNSGRTRQILGDGSFGGSYKVKDEIMQEIFDALLEDVLKLLEFGGF